MIASLGMYDMPGLQPANDRFWTAIRTELGQGPAQLTRGKDLWDIWQSPDLLLAQTCGYPFRARLHGRVALVGTPDHGLAGCPPGYYRSVLVVRDGGESRSLDDFDDAAFAYNEALSQSGWAAPVGHLLARGLRPGSLLCTGSHAASARAVAAGDADLAGLDALTWQLLCDHAPNLAGRLRVLDRTVPTPALPYITAQGREAPAIFTALDRAIAGLDPATRAALRLRGLVAIPAAEYLALPNPPGPEQICPRPGNAGNLR